MTRARFAVPVLAALVALAPCVSAADSAFPDQKELQASLDKAYDYLKGTQAQDGSWATRGGPGVTALTAAGLVKAGRKADDPVVAAAVKYVEGYVQKDGGVYARGLETYTTALAVVMFKEANTDKKYDKVIDAAMKYLKGLQDGTDDKKLGYGGMSYGPKMGGPDVSNTGFFVEALVAAGAGKDDPALKKALVFLSRAQNLPGEEQDQPFAKKAEKDDEGGFVYNPGDDPTKSTKGTAAGGLRSEGGMTYTGLKSFLYAGVDKKDKRVAAAIKWIAKHYTLDENPGQKTAGLFYYYHTFAKAMDALGDDEFTDADGKKHPWRKELFDKLKGMQAKDGSWVNKDGAFMENNPDLCTSFAVLSLAYTLEKKK